MKNIKIILLILIVTLTTSLEIFAENNTLSGYNRFDTAIKISNRYQQSKEIILVNSNAISDVLCATSLASTKNIPILLTNKSKLNEDTLKEIKRLNTSLVYIIGGESVIHKFIEKELENINIKFKRISGKDRYETSIKVAQEINLYKNINNVAIVNGESICDAISISSVTKNTPIILSKKDDLGIAKEYIQNENINKAYIIGGENSLSDNITTYIKDYKRIYGKDRYDTNIKVIEEFTDNKQINRLYYCKGNESKDEDLIDGLLISPKAANNNAITLLLGDEIKENQKSILKKFRLTDIIQVGRKISENLKNEIESLKVIENKQEIPNNNYKPQKPNKSEIEDETPKEESPEEFPSKPDNPIEPPIEEVPIKPDNPIEPPIEEVPIKPDNPVNPPSEELPDDTNNSTNTPNQDNKEESEENDIEDKKEVIVNSDKTLKEALKDKSVDIIRLGKNIVLQNYGLNINRPVNIDGNNYTIDGRLIKPHVILIGGDGIKLSNLNIEGRGNVIKTISANVELNNIKVVTKSETDPAISIISSIVKVNNLELDSKYSGIEIRKYKNINQLKLIIDGEVSNVNKDYDKNNTVIRIKNIDNIVKEDIIDFGIYEEQYDYKIIANEDNLKDKIYYRKNI